MFRRIGTEDSSQHNELKEDYGDYFDGCDEYLADLEIDANELVDVFTRAWLPSETTQREMDRLQMIKDGKLETLRNDGIRCGKQQPTDNSSQCVMYYDLDYNNKHVTKIINERRENNKAILEADVPSTCNSFVRAKADK